MNPLLETRNYSENTGHNEGKHGFPLMNYTSYTAYEFG